MSAIISLRDGLELQISNLKYVTYKNFVTESVSKIENFNEFYLRDEYYNFVCEDSNFVVHGRDIHFVKFS